MPQFSRDQTSLLITLYESYPCLYVVASPDYKNKNKRNEAISEITTSIQEITGVSFTEDEVRKKIHVLRTQFLKEVSNIKKCLASGMAEESLYKSHLWCFEQLKFLRESAPVRKGESNLLRDESENVSS